MAQPRIHRFEHRLAAVLEHPLLGDRTWRTILALTYVTAGSALVLLSAWRTTIFTRGPTLPWFVDQLAALTIVLAVASTFILGLGYALWNGGPLLAMAIPLTHPISGALAVGTIALDIDLVLALATASLAGTAALIRPFFNRAVPSNRRERHVYLWATLIVTVFTIVAGAALLRVAVAVGPHAARGVWVASISLLVAVFGLGYKWGSLIHGGNRDRASPSTPESQ